MTRMQFLRVAVAMAGAGETTDGRNSLVLRGRFGNDVAASCQPSYVLSFHHHIAISSRHMLRKYMALWALPLCTECRQHNAEGSAKRVQLHLEAHEKGERCSFPVYPLCPKYSEPAFTCTEMLEQRPRALVPYRRRAWRYWPCREFPAAYSCKVPLPMKISPPKRIA